jgi:hypothetical protein
MNDFLTSITIMNKVNKKFMEEITFLKKNLSYFEGLLNLFFSHFVLLSSFVHSM